MNKFNHSAMFGLANCFASDQMCMGSDGDWHSFPSHREKHVGFPQIALVQEIQAHVLVREVDAFSGVSPASRVTFGDFNS